MPRRLGVHGSPASRTRLAVLVALGVLASLLVLVAAPILPTDAAETPTVSGPLSVTRTTWDIVGLKSNISTANMANSPRKFPVGIQICNTSGAAVANVTAALAVTSEKSQGNALAIGQPSPGSPQPAFTIAANSCRHVYYEVEVAPGAANKPELAAAFGKTAAYTWTVSATGVTTFTRTGKLFVEKLVSQNRNAILRIESNACSATSSACNVVPGQEYSFTLYSKSAPGGYLQMGTFLNLPQSAFEITNVQTRYSTPVNATASGTYADGCGWNHYWWDSTRNGGNASRECVGPINYAGGKVGGNLIRTTYTVKVRSTATAGTSAPISALIYDLSGSSFHYNADYNTGTATTLRQLTVMNPADLSVTKTHTGTFIKGGTGTYNLTVANAGTSTSAPTVTVVDTLPVGSGLTFRASPNHYTAGASGFTCVINSTTQVTCTRSTAIVSGASATGLQLHVDVAAGASASVVNTATVSQSGGTNIVDPTSTNNTVTDTATTASAGQADLVVTNAAVGAIARNAAGQYAVAIRNDGPSAIPAPIELTYTLSNGVTFSSATGTSWSCSASGQTVTCINTNGGSPLASLASLPTLTINVAVDSGAADPVITAATAVSTGATPPTDPVTTNNTDVRMVKGVGSADLSIIKSNPGVFTITPEANGTLNTGTFTIAVSNSGPDAAHASATDAIRVTDTLPTELTFVSATGTGWSCSVASGVLTCDRTTALASGTVSSIAVVMSVPKESQGAVEGLVLNSASVTGPTADPDPTDNTSDDATMLRNQTDVQIVKTGPNTSGTPTSITGRLRLEHRLHTRWSSPTTAPSRRPTSSSRTRCRRVPGSSA